MLLALPLPVFYFLTFNLYTSVDTGLNDQIDRTQEYMLIGKALVTNTFGHRAEPPEDSHTQSADKREAAPDNDWVDYQRQSPRPRLRQAQPHSMH
jgi:hypothetical protein